MYTRNNQVLLMDFYQILPKRYQPAEIFQDEKIIYHREFLFSKPHYQIRKTYVPLPCLSPFKLYYKYIIAYFTLFLNINILAIYLLCKCDTTRRCLVAICFRYAQTRYDINPSRPQGIPRCRHIAPRRGISQITTGIYIAVG